MKRLLATLCCLPLAIPLLAAEAPPAVDEPKSLGEALAAGTFRLGLRYRYENVADDARPDRDARASTLRTAPGWESAPYRGLSFHLEVENVAVVGNELYNNAGAGSLGNGLRDRPVVADPALTELNQAFVRYARGGSRLQVGRQELVRGDQRFVGNVGWRQNHQSFDAVSFAYEGAGGWKLHYAWVDAVQRIFGDSQDTSSHLLDLTVAAGGAGKATVYGYLLDYEERLDAALSTTTLGAELAGSRELAPGRTLLWEAEYARQRDAADNPRRIDADYLHGMLGGKLGGVTARLGLEVLSGGPGGGPFRTPLATLHKFNGWADKFLATPAGGLEDLYLSLDGAVGKVRWTVVLHEFGAESGGADYGSELDLQLLYTTPWKQTVGLKAALYDADAFSTDTEKWMLWTSYGI